MPHTKGVHGPISNREVTQTDHRFGLLASRTSVKVTGELTEGPYLEDKEPGAIPWDASKHMESVVALAMELSIWGEVDDFYEWAAKLYNESGRSQLASDAFAKDCLFSQVAADTMKKVKVLENVCMEQAVEL
ncbi:hypothetical protein R6Q57_026096 [Mikania cordata]